MRIKNLDLIKFTGLALVILNHFGPQDYLIIDSYMQFNFFIVYRGFLAIGVGLLLIVSGYLIIPKNYSLETIIKKVIHLVFLLIFFKFLYGLAFNSLDLSYNSIVYTLTTTAAQGYRVNSLWYMYALISIYLLLPFISKIFENKKLFLYLTILILSYTFGFSILENIFNLTHQHKMQLFQTLYPFQTHYLFALAYFLIGGMFRIYEDKIKHYVVNNLTIISILCISILIHSFYFIYISNVSDKTFDPMYDGYATLTNAINVTLIFYFFRYRFKEVKTKFIEQIAQYSLGIYLLHWPIAYYCKNLLMGNITTNQYIDNLLCSIIVMIICFLICKLLSYNKYLQKLIKL